MGLGHVQRERMIRELRRAFVSARPGRLNVWPRAFTRIIGVAFSSLLSSFGQDRHEGFAEVGWPLMYILLDIMTVRLGALTIGSFRNRCFEPGMVSHHGSLFAILADCCCFWHLHMVGHFVHDLIVILQGVV